MKIKNLIILLLLFFVSNAYCQCGCPNPHFKPRQYGFYMPCGNGGCPNPCYKPRQYVLYVPVRKCCTLSCNCTDPACLWDCCMSCEKCCAAFGNVGAGDFEPLGVPWMPSHPCGQPYVPRRDVVAFGAGFSKIAENIAVASAAPHAIRQPMLHRKMLSFFHASPCTKQHITQTYPAGHHYVLKKCHHALMRPYPKPQHYVLLKPKSCKHPVKVR